MAICTWNRCDLLRQTLEQLTKLVVPPDVEWELLVVNNNCTDGTDEVIQSFRGRLPIRGLFEARPGKSFALNLAAREARGAYILWTDDDVLVDAQWLAEYSRAFRTWPDAVVFGGSIDPWFDGEPPSWLRTVLPRIGNAYALRRLGDTPIPLEPPEIMPFGANMAVRREDQLRFLYDTSVGPRPQSHVRGEETLLVNEMLNAGLTGWWVPSARVLHCIGRDRQTVRHIRDYYVGWGEFVVDHESRSPHERLIFGIPRWVLRAVVESEVTYRLKRLIAPPEVWIDALIGLGIARGQFRALRARARRLRHVRSAASASSATDRV